MNKNIKKLSDYIPEPPKNTNNSNMLNHRNQINAPYNKSVEVPSKQLLSPPEISRTFIQVKRQSQSLFASSGKSCALGVQSTRLKLKDYLHLNSIQKKSKVSRSKENSLLESKTIKQSKVVGSESNGVRTPGLKESILLKSSQISTSNNTRQIMKQQIQRQIKQQISKLNSISQYISQDFVESTEGNQATLVLFNIIKNVKENDHNLEQVSKSLSDYESRLEGFAEQKGKYFWNETARLQSPAKMLQRGLQLTSKGIFLENIGLKL